MIISFFFIIKFSFLSLHFILNRSMLRRVTASIFTIVYYRE
nr:MAG TPA: hypothetical protein [Bacteriophage sp.]